MIKKRIGSALLACLMWLTCVMPTLTACSKAAQNKYTVGEWLDKVEDSFNLVYFTQSEPYFSDINEDNDYFSIAQIAAEWGVVDPAEGLKLEKAVTKEFCADTLVKAMNFNYEADVQIADEDKLAHPETVKIAVSEGLFDLSSAGKFTPSYEPTRQEADKALLIARDHWVNLTYEESYDNSVVREGVVNLGGVAEEKAPVAAAQSDFKVSYGGSVSLFDESGNYSADSVGGDITFEKDKLPADIETGSFLILPPDDTIPTSHAVKVDSIVENADGTVTITTGAAQMMDVYENLDIQQSETVDFSNAVFFDANGNKIETHTSTTEDMAYFGGVESWSPAAAIQPLNIDSMALGKEISGEIPLGSGLKVKFKCKDGKIDLIGEYKSGDKTFTFTKQVPKIDFDTKIDAKWEWDWFNSGIKVKTARAIVSYDDSASIKYEYSKEWADEGITGEDEDADVRLDLMYAALRGIYSELKSQGQTDAGKFSTTLMSIILPTGTGIDPQLVVRLNVDFKGSISFSIESKARYGAELVKNKIRIVNDVNVKKTLEFDGKVEGTFFIGLGITALGCTAIDVGANAGAGVEFNIKVRKTDSVTGNVVEEMALPFGCGASVKCEGDEASSAQPTVIQSSKNSELHVCGDFKIYPIFNIECCTSKSLVGKLFGGVQLSIFDDKSVNSIAHLEWSDGLKFVKKCTFDGEEGDGIAVKTGSELKLTDDKALVGVDADTDYLNIEMIPKLYKLKDLQISVEDESIAKAELDTAVSSDEKKDLITPNVSLSFTGKFLTKNDEDDQPSASAKLYYKSSPVTKKNLIKIHGVADGVTMCTLSTKDGKYSVQAKIVVGNGGLGNATAGSLIPEQYSYTIVPGGSAEIKLSAYPTDYDASMLTYSSSDTSVAEVSVGGKITGKADGSAVVTIATTDGKYTAMVRVFVDNSAGSGTVGGGGDTAGGGIGGAW